MILKKKDCEVIEKTLAAIGGWRIATSRPVSKRVIIARHSDYHVHECQSGNYVEFASWVGLCKII